VFTDGGGLTFAYQTLAGDGEVVARLPQWSSSQRTAVGLTIRAAVSADDPRWVGLLRLPSGRLALSAGVEPTQVGPLAPAATWVKLERHGARVSALYSADGTTWKALGDQDLAAPLSSYAGLVLGSDVSEAEPVAATFTNVRVAGSSTLPPDWSASDVGGTLGAAATTFNNGEFRAVAAAGTHGGTEDRLRFVYRRVVDDVDLVARVVLTGATGSVAGIALRQELAATSVMGARLLLLGGALLGEGRSAPGSLARSSASTRRTGPVWLKLSRRDSQVTFFESSDGATWTATNTEVLQLDGSFHIGLVVAGGDGSATAQFDHVTVNAANANLPPRVSIQTSYRQGASTQPLGITALAEDPDDRVSVVEFLVDGARIGVDTAVPYAATWTPVAPGAHTVTAIAVDSEGARTASQPVSVYVIEDPRAPQPSTAPTNPAPGAPVSTTAAPAAQPTPTTPLPSLPGPAPTTPTSVTPWRLVFNPSPDHDRNVDRYVLEVRTVSGHYLVLAVNLGRPPVAGGECSVDVTSSFERLSAGAYDVALTAVDDSTGLSSSAAVASFTR
jgi:hypothetical protein